MNRFGRITSALVALLFAVGAVAVAQADDGWAGSAGRGGSGDAGGSRTKTVDVVTTPAPGTTTAPVDPKRRAGNEDEQGDDPKGAQPDDHVAATPAADDAVPPAEA